MTGIDIKKANRAADGRSNPRNKPALMVVPLRDAPGKTAKICITPINNESIQFIFSRDRVRFPKYSARDISKAAV